jgi:transposase
MKKIEILNKQSIKTCLDTYLNQTAQLRFIQRLQVINYLIENDDVSCITAGKTFNVSPKAVQNWVNKINETCDIESLRDQPGKGRKTRLTKDQLVQIEKAVKGNPEKVGMKAKQWNGALLAEYITKKLGVELQLRQCQRMLQKFGVASPSGRPWN